MNIQPHLNTTYIPVQQRTGAKVDPNALEKFANVKEYRLDLYINNYPLYRELNLADSAKRKARHARDHFDSLPLHKKVGEALGNAWSKVKDVQKAVKETIYGPPKPGWDGAGQGTEHD
jgi:hypothetical protein